MGKEILNKKWWYRALKVLFFIVFIFSLFLGYIIAFSIVDNKEIRPETYIEIGKKTKQYFPVYNDVNDEELGRKSLYKIESSNFIYDGGEFGGGRLTRKLLKDDIDKMTVYTERYSLWQKILIYIIIYLIIAVFFYFIAEIFYYIVVGEFTLIKKAIKLFRKAWTRNGIV